MRNCYAYYCTINRILRYETSHTKIPAAQQSFPECIPRLMPASPTRCYAKNYDPSFTSCRSSNQTLLHPSHSFHNPVTAGSALRLAALDLILREAFGGDGAVTTLDLAARVAEVNSRVHLRLAVLLRVPFRWFVQAYHVVRKVPGEEIDKAIPRFLAF